MGEYELAEDNLRQAVERDQTDPTVHEHMGDLYEKTGRIRQAAEQWELSVAEFQKTPELDQHPGYMAKVDHSWRMRGSSRPSKTTRWASRRSNSGVSGTSGARGARWPAADARLVRI